MFTSFDTIDSFDDCWSGLAEGYRCNCAPVSVSLCQCLLSAATARWCVRVSDRDIWHLILTSWFSSCSRHSLVCLSLAFFIEMTFAGSEESSDAAYRESADLLTKSVSVCQICQIQRPYGHVRLQQSKKCCWTISVGRWHQIQDRLSTDSVSLVIVWLSRISVWTLLSIKVYSWKNQNAESCTQPLPQPLPKELFDWH